MPDLYGFTPTTAGRGLIASLLAGQTLTITRAMVGSGKPDSLDAMAALTDLVAPVARATSTTPVRTGDAVSLTVEYRSDMNGGLQEGFSINEYGIFAKTATSAETLIFYGCLGDHPQWVYPYSPGVAPDVRDFPVKIQISSEVEVQIDYHADAFITAEEAAALLESMVEKATAGSKLVEITIPAESWALDESLAPDLEMPGTMPIYPYYADVTVPEAQASYFPAAALHTESLEAAAAAGMAPVVQALEGKVRFRAKEPPGSALAASLALLSGGKDSAGQGFGVVNVGTALQINVPGGVAGLDSAGKIPASLLPGMGFIEMIDGDIPAEQRMENTIYASRKWDVSVPAESE